jgi:2-iminobutanoate/2-iminopropanoate deaminase
MAKKTLNPPGMPVPRGSYSQVVISKPGRVVFIAGNTASDPNGNVVGLADVRAQTRYILEKIKLGVEAAGGTLQDIVSMSVFTTDARYHAAINEVRRDSRIRFSGEYHGSGGGAGAARVAARN